jgi:hypothetical protein
LRGARHAGLVARSLRRLFAVLVLGTVLAVPYSGIGSGATPSATVGWPLLIAPVHQQGLFYVLVSEPCGAMRCLHLYRSRDADESTLAPPLKYVPLTLPPYGRLARSPQGTVLAMVFVSQEIGYILEGTSEARVLYVTRDGAHSWQRSPIPHDDTIWGLTATGTHLYALFVHCSFASHGCTYMELVHAPLRATWWRGVKIPFGEFSEQQPLGQVTGHEEMMMFAETSKSGARIYVSHNGGRSFISATHFKLKGSHGCSLVAENVQQVWALCSSNTSETLHLSDASGTSWSVFVRHPHDVTPSGIFSLTNTDDFAYFYTGTVTRNIVRMNLGANREHIVGTLRCRSVASMTFISVADGYAVCTLLNGATALYRTKSGGESWRRLVVPR